MTEQGGETGKKKQNKMLIWLGCISVHLCEKCLKTSFFFSGYFHGGKKVMRQGPAQRTLRLWSFLNQGGELTVIALWLCFCTYSIFMNTILQVHSDIWGNRQ